MPSIRISTKINASKEICFDLARSIDLHQVSMQQSNEKAIAGRTKGLIEMNEEVTWQATHFGIKQKLTSKITQFDFPNSFRDEMVKGAFKKFTHDHIFLEKNGETEMQDIFDFESPFGWFGKIFNQLILEKYMTQLLIKRNQTIKEIAENGKWKEILKKS
ncbi:MAG: cell division protein [Saprospiraceae bacterium]